MNQNNSRREFLKTAAGLLAIPAVVTLAQNAFAEEKKKKKGEAAAAAGAGGALVSPNDPTAKALKYVEKSTEAGKNCANCVLFQACGKPQGGCTLFPGKEVKAAGWCSSWNPHPTCKG